MFMTLRNVLAFFAAFFGTLQPSDERTGGKFREQSYSRFACFRVFVRTISRMFAIFRNVDIDYSMPPGIFAVCIQIKVPPQ